ncbi:CTP synthase, partial [Candidatus Saccharibacteria bacterium]|nr:CTP synthase [Candidatus Saccharibacteria bacterium]
FKSKPAQNALNELRGFGIVPDCVVVRTEEPAPGNVGEKISRFSGVPENAVIMLHNVKTVFQIPLTIAASGINDVLTKFTGNDVKPNLRKWEDILLAQSTVRDTDVTVGLVAKYMDNEDTYISVLEALKSAAWKEEVNLTIKWLNAETADVEDFKQVDALLVPGGFGERGVPGKIAAATYALETGKPYLGLCLGLQVAVIAAARRAGLTDAHSTEFDANTPYNVVYIMEGQEGKESTGGTLRLGDYEAKLTAGSRVADVYGATDIVERHRHRYEVNQAFKSDIEKGGLVISGTSPDGKLVEFVESLEHPYFVATQAHPELKSRPNRAHPLFTGLIKAAK